MKFSKAFSLIELIFVIVILGILAAVALPKLGNTAVQAQIAKGRADIATIRAAIVNERQTRLILGDSDYITKANMDTASGLFGGVLTYPIANSNTDGDWYTATIDNGSYTYNVNGIGVDFTYNDSTAATVADRGTFTCSTTAGSAAQNDMCSKLIN